LGTKVVQQKKVEGASAVADTSRSASVNQHRGVEDPEVKGHDGRRGNTQEVSKENPSSRTESGERLERLPRRKEKIAGIHKEKNQRTPQMTGGKGKSPRGGEEYSQKQQTRVESIARVKAPGTGRGKRGRQRDRSGGFLKEGRAPVARKVEKSTEEERRGTQQWVRKGEVWVLPKPVLSASKVSFTPRHNREKINFSFIREGDDTLRGFAFSLGVAN